MSKKTKADLEKELEVTDQLLAERDRLLEAIPPCPIHGKCVPHAIEWVEEQKTGGKTMKDAHNVILVNVRWCDGYLEAFECSQVRQGGQILWMRLIDGQNRTVPLLGVRWFSTDPESHAFLKTDALKAL